MARPVWTGVLTFGLVTVPVSLYTATDSHGVSFHQLQRGTGDRVRNKRVNERTGDEVPYSEIVKGYEVTDGEYVVVEPEELEQISPGRSRTIDISGFVDLDQVDPIFFDKTYYLGPKGKEYAKIFSLLTDALARSNRAGIALFSMRGKEYLTAVRADDGLLELHTMHWADEVRDARKEIGDLPSGKAAYSKQELATAQQLIDMLSVDWDPSEYHDTFEEQVKKLIEDKLAGRETAASEGPPAEATNVVDLMDVLKRSLEGVKGGTTRSSAGDEPAKRAARAGRTAAPKKSTGAEEDLSRLTKAQLYEKATQYEIAHRSTMTRDELQKAVAKATRTRLRAAS
ncbi:Ku protein [Streptomyces sp. TLI_171]|uniref:non-homologous end joining protein Ku n=1 Tax=Streptomyces sp. TLI_171 TaxID=1938859 RepID=UPI000C1768C9|nr:Ku protein [Streptomyces sp. TLI_171]RKE23662.1 DNA end-binding protein Ku [Streptomyces sp. TLI_171]